MNTIYYGNELYHHGILGQKWGVRRYQNPDGTRTAAGKKRRYEDLSDLSDQEVQNKLNRARNELQYHQTKRQLEKELSGIAAAEDKVSDAQKMLKSVVGITGSVTALYVLGKKLVPGGLSAVKDISIAAVKAGRVAGNMKALRALG